MTELTNSQKKLVDDIKDWDAENKSLAYTISGQAGVGKSFITKYIIKNVFRKKRVAVSAPTHKAVKVVENFSGIKGYTIHSLHGLRPNFSLADFNIDKLKFETLGSNKFMKYNIIFVDESSMISPALYKLNNVRALQYNVKVIYIGDKLQLPPILNNNTNSIKLSPVFNNEFGFELTDIVRQAESNPLHVLFKLLRNDIKNDGSTFLDYLNRYPEINNIKDGHGYKVMPILKTKGLILDAFKTEEFKSNPTSYKIGTYTNKRVDSWNKLIRSNTMNSDDIIVKGDILMGYKTIVDEYLSPIIINSNDYKVIDVYYKESDYKFNIYVTTLKDLNTGFIYTVNIVDHLNNNFKYYKAKIKQLHHAALYADILKKGEMWKKFYNFKDMYLTMVDFELTDTNNKVLARVHKELDYGYAVTIHKLQGSTIENMFIDVLDIAYFKSNKKTPRYNYGFNNQGIIELRNRMLYTAISRVSEQATIIF